jgi:hypothetical protein
MAESKHAVEEFGHRQFFDGIGEQDLDELMMTLNGRASSQS